MPNYFLAAVLAMATFLPALGLAESNNDAIKFGALMPLTGEFAMQAAAFHEGARLAVEEVNAQAGLRNRLLKLVVEDTQGSSRSANSAAQKLISFDKVIAAITTTYPETQIGGAQFQRAKIPSLALWDSSPEIDDMGDYIFSIGPWTPSGAEVGARFCFEDLQGRTAVIVNNTEAWSELISDLYTKEFESLGGKVIKRLSINPSNTDFHTIIAKIANLAPDVLYVPLTGGIVAFHTQLAAARFDRPVVSADIITEAHILENPPVFENVYQSGIKDPNRPETKELAAMYQKKFGRKMTMPWFVGTGYDAIKLLSLAVEKVGPEGGK